MARKKQPDRSHNVRIQITVTRDEYQKIQSDLVQHVVACHNFRGLSAYCAERVLGHPSAVQGRGRPRKEIAANGSTEPAK